MNPEVIEEGPLAYQYEGGIHCPICHQHAREHEQLMPVTGAPDILRDRGGAIVVRFYDETEMPNGAQKCDTCDVPIG